MSLWKIVVTAAATLALVSCDSEEKKAAAQVAVDRFRLQMAQQQFSEIEREWSGTSALKRSPLAGQIADAMKNLSMQLGAVQSAKEVACRVEAEAVTLAYETVFEKKGKAEERFVFQVKDGLAHLDQYHLGGVSIQSANAG